MSSRTVKAFFPSISTLLYCFALLLPESGLAHSFGEPYQLPMPYWMYIYGAMAALILSFVVLALFINSSSAPPERFQKTWTSRRAYQFIQCFRLIGLIKTLVCGSFLLALVAGLIGSGDSYRNFNMTFFWIVFALGGVYLSALIGDWYAHFNPWKILANSLPGFQQARITYPTRLAYWPALMLYMGFIGLELFGDIKPFSLSVSLLIFTAIQLLGCFLFGSKHWFHYGDFFAVMFRLSALMSPCTLHQQQIDKQNPALTLTLRIPFSGLLNQRPEHFSLLVFLLFMLSSTAFDGLRETALWFNLFWKDPFNILTPLLGRNPIYEYVMLRPWYIGFESLTLVISPFIYLGLFLVFLWLGKIITASKDSLLTLANQFAFSLLPIALVYHITHYYTLLLSQGVKIRGLISDPFGWGWNLFGTAITGRIPVLPDMGFIWDSQVWLILIGHVASVWIAHFEALRYFPSHRKASLSQLPMLALMVLFTGAGLWILAQPLQG
ncbi:hypothetical protein IB286_10340 [Spongiibacter sp. KMU-158]|uniref:Fenitrothion hydrolase FedB n=1 Tax=Spongiibacter pelagi TaxID=2760804 RepID=A0A927C3C7_9GAMM|nr:hypothetical protein [Spongiibacter pelagi]MBD2859403.1 hypothetical protein [Spongiibacter pelagi]